VQHCFGPLILLPHHIHTHSLTPFIVAQLKTGGDLFFVELSSASGGTSKELDVKDIGNGSYQVTFVPDKHGEYILKVQIDGAHIVGSPFVCRVAQSLFLPFVPF
jgi:hypothetical protein